MSFDKWKARLAGTTPAPIAYLRPDGADEGYYRRPLMEGRKPNGRPNIVGWEPVAYWLLDGVLVGSIGNRDMTPADLSNEELWSYAVQNPISYQTFCAVIEGGPWPSDAPALAPARRVTENQDPEKQPAKEPETAEEHRAAIMLIVDTIGRTHYLNNEEDAAIALGTKNRLASLRLAADKAGQALYKPHYAAYKKLFDQWTPMVKAAEQAEAVIGRSYLQFQERRRQEAAKAAIAAALAASEEEERNRRAADRAIARGEPEQEPEVQEEVAPTPVAPAPVAPTFGTRKPREEMQIFVDKIVDEAALAAYFRGRPEVISILTTLAQRAIKQGHTVPGITTREGYV